VGLRWRYLFDAPPAGLVCVTSAHIRDMKPAGCPPLVSSVVTDLATVNPRLVMRPGVYQFVIQGREV
jgi:hypothetical protein